MYESYNVYAMHMYGIRHALLIRTKPTVLQHKSHYFRRTAFVCICIGIIEMSYISMESIFLFSMESSLPIFVLVAHVLADFEYIHIIYVCFSYK